MKAFLLYVVLILSAAAHAEVKNFDWMLGHSRKAASEGRHGEAVQIYIELLASLPKKDPRVEILSAEMILSRYALKDDAKTERDAIRFLQAYSQSQFGFTISYILAAAQLGLGKFPEAFSVFSSFTFEQVRGLQDDPKEKVYEVLIRSLAGMRQEPASQALRADVNGMLIGKDGAVLLTGPIKNILDKVRTWEDLDALILNVPNPIDRDRIYALLGGRGSRTVDPFVPTWMLGVGISHDSAVGFGTSVQQFMPRVQFGVGLPITEAGSSIGLQGSIDLAAISAAPSGTQFRSLDWDVFIDGKMFGQSQGLSFDFSLGIQYRTSSNKPSQFGYRDIYGLFGRPEFRYGFGSNSVGLYVLGAPLARVRGKLDLHNQLWVVGIDFASGRHTIYLEGQRVRYRSTPTTGAVFLGRVSVGYKVSF